MNKFIIILTAFFLQGCMHNIQSDKDVAEQIIEDIHSSTSLSMQKDIKTLSTSTIKGDYISEIKKRHFLQKIRQGIVSFGKYKVISYDDKLIMEIRQLRQSSEINQKTIPQKNSLITSDANLTGEILRLKNNYCSLTLMITNLKTGLTVWEGNYDIKCN